MDRKKFHNVYARAYDNVKHRRENPVDNLPDPRTSFSENLAWRTMMPAKESSENKFAAGKVAQEHQEQNQMMITRVARWSTPSAILLKRLPMACFRKIRKMMRMSPIVKMISQYFGSMSVAIIRTVRNKIESARNVGDGGKDFSDHRFHGVPHPPRSVQRTPQKSKRTAG